MDRARHRRGREDAYIVELATPSDLVRFDRSLVALGRVALRVPRGATSDHWLSKIVGQASNPVWPCGSRPPTERLRAPALGARWSSGESSPRHQPHPTPGSRSGSVPLSQLPQSPEPKSAANRPLRVLYSWRHLTRERSQPPLDFEARRGHAILDATAKTGAEAHRRGKWLSRRPPFHQADSYGERLLRRPPPDRGHATIHDSQPGVPRRR